MPAAAALMAYGWALWLGPLSDDYVLHRWAVSGTLAPAEWTYVRPLPLGVWSVLTSTGAGWPSLHAVNVLGHALNSALVAMLAATLLGPVSGVSAGLLFAAFPASAEAVAWTAGTFDVLATTGVLVAVVAALRMPMSGHRLTIVVVAALAAMLCKETAVVAPVLVALALAARGDDSAAWRRHAAMLAVMSLTAAGVAAARLSSSGHLQNLPHGRRAWKDLLLRPFAAAAVPARDGEPLASTLLAVAVLSLAALALWNPSSVTNAGARGARRVGLVGLLWALAAAMPLLSQFQVTGTLEGSRYLYLPFVGFALALGSALAATSRPRLARVVVALVLTIFIWRLDTERRVWLEAAHTRDLLLAQAERLVRETPCRALSIEKAPDNVSGAYVFRQGLAQALEQLPRRSDGAACTARWDGDALHGGPVVP